MFFKIKVKKLIFKLCNFQKFSDNELGKIVGIKILYIVDVRNFYSTKFKILNIY